MTAPNMETITSSLERSLRNCSLNHQNTAGDGERSSSSDEVPPDNQPTNSDDTILELNSQISLPYQWEQCLDLKTGEIYYINRSNGMKAREDPRFVNGYLYSEEDDDDDDDDDDNSCYDSEEDESCSESSPSSCSSRNIDYYGGKKKEEHVLVVAGCKSCFMYYMVPKQDVECPKCSGQLLHFDRSENRS